MLSFRRAAFLLLVPVWCLLQGAVTTTGALADTPTPLPVVTPTPIFTATATATATLTPVPTSTPTPTVTPAPTTAPVRVVSSPSPTASSVATAAPTHVVHHRRHHHPTATPTPTPEATPSGKTRHHHPYHQKPAAVPSPVPTATSPITLQVSNSVAPVICNGSTRPNAVRPFLTPPYDGWTSIVSYVDHDLPDYYQDGLVVTAAGQTARPDAAHHASDFPAYWSDQLRQYLYYDGHNGYDYDVSYVPIYAAAPGTVIFAGAEYPDALDHGYGNMVMINHHNGYITLYGHFSKFLVHAGERVRRGQQIGISGNTGHSSGPHLHFTVLHNCSPTDPYGWTGVGSDPLAAYQGETSTYLWRQAPLVTNPVPNLPGIGALPGYSGYRLLLLQLPGTHQGLPAFTRALRLEEERARAALGVRAIASVDLLRGAILLRSPIPPAQIYRVPGVVSIGSPDAAPDARADLLAALAQATLVSRRATINLGHEHGWHGLLMRWDGRTLLLGQGQKGEALDLRLPRGYHAGVTTLQADPTNGTYAVDLGRLSQTQMVRLRKQLEDSKPRVRHVHYKTVVPSHPPVHHITSTASFPVGIVIGIVLLVGAAVVAEVWRRRHGTLLPR